MGNEVSRDEERPGPESASQGLRVSIGLMLAVFVGAVFLLLVYAAETLLQSGGGEV